MKEQDNEKFPVNIFPDIENENKDFPKYNKKNISEDYIAENFKRMGWNAYTPYADTGIDLIVTKNIINDSGKPKRITRFIQIKTRTLKQNKNGNPFFGYTLKTKDFREDPRGVILFYNDNPDFNGRCDIFVIPMYEFFKFFYNNSDYSSLSHHNNFGESQFSTVTFRQENGKMNSIKYDLKHKAWKYGNDETFGKFLNKKGYDLIDSLNIEENFDFYQNKINKMKQRLYYHQKSMNNLTRSEFSKLSTGLSEHYNKISSDKLVDLYYSKMDDLFNKIIKESDESRKQRFYKMNNFVHDPNNLSPEALRSFEKYHDVQRKND